MVTVKCKTCKTPFQARVADRKRGWGLFCSKSCKAIKQTQVTGRGKPRGMFHDDDGFFTVGGEDDLEDFF
jgi:hypothetical protein